MAEKRPSYTSPMPMRAAVDTRLSASALRLIMAVAWHDRMSLMTGTGAGCTASNKTLAAEIGVRDYTTLIKLRKHCEETGYFQLEPRQGGKRLEVIRVIPDHLADPKRWPFDQSFIGEGCLKAWHARERKVGEIANISAEEVGELANDDAEKVGEPNSETRGNLPKTEPQYIPLKGETYSSKEGGRDSTEVAHFSQSASDEIPARHWEKSSNQAICRDDLRVLVIFAVNILGSQKALHDRSGVPTSYISRAKNGDSIPHAHGTALVAACEQVLATGRGSHRPIGQFGTFGLFLPAEFDAKSRDVQLHYLEQAFKLLPGRELLADAEEQIDGFLEVICEEDCGEPSGHRAQRMREELDRWLPA